MREVVVRTVTTVLFGVALLLPLCCAITGAAQATGVADAYLVHYGHLGDTCDSAQDAFLYLNVDDGKPLACSIESKSAMLFDVDGSMPYFTTGQHNQVLSLAAKLGAHGLSTADEQRLQSLVNSIAATVPASAGPPRYSGLWGWRLIALGLGIAAVLIGLFVSPWRRRLEVKLAGFTVPKSTRESVPRG